MSGEHDIILLQLFQRLGLLGSVINEAAEGATLSLSVDFFLPLLKQSQRCNNESRRSLPGAVLGSGLVVAEQRDSLHSLAKTHLICKDTTAELFEALLSDL